MKLVSYSIKIFILLVLMAKCYDVLPMTIAFDGNNILMEGEIKYGDKVKLDELLHEDLSRLILANAVFINSPGGDVEEALYLSRLINKYNLTVIIDEQSQCSSACFLIFSTASARILAGNVFIHRPYFTKVTHEMAGIEYMKNKQKRIINEMKNHLEKSLVPAYMIDGLIDTASDEAIQLSISDYTRLGVFSESWEEVLIATDCSSSLSSSFSGSPLHEKIDCHKNTAIASRFEIIRREISPKAAREALRKLENEQTNKISSASGERIDDSKRDSTAYKSNHGKTKKIEGKPWEQDWSTVEDISNEEDIVSNKKKSDEYNLSSDKMLDENTKPKKSHAKDRSEDIEDKYPPGHREKLSKKMNPLWDSFVAKADIHNIKYQDPGDPIGRIIVLMNDIYPELSQLGDHEAMLQYAISVKVMYKDEEHAHKLQQMAAEHGSIVALLYIASNYENGIGVDQSDLLAYCYYKLYINRQNTEGDMDDFQSITDDIKQRLPEIKKRLSDSQKQKISATISLLESNLPIL